jgi:NAD(P)-dependent dehydrogenase (short-subunit alcohol dehydrogenase family)
MKGSSNGQFAYAASKAAFVHLTRSLATTLKEAGIRVNQVSFSPMQTPHPTFHRCTSS